MALLDLSQLQLEKDSYVDEKLRSYFSDLVYSTMTTTQTPVKVALLSEHKSYPDEWVDFQALRYQMGYWVREFEKFEAEKAVRKKEEEEWAKSDPRPTREARPPLRQTVTPILVLLVYHGKEEWKVSLRFARHFTGMEDPNSPLSQALGRYVPDFEPYFINFSAIADEAIQGEVSTRLFVLVMKYIFANGLGGHLDEILQMAADVLKQPNGMAMVSALLRYIGRSAVKIDKAEMVEKLLQILPKEGEALMDTIASEWIDEGKKIGVQEGKKIGVQEGETSGWIKAQRAMILQILHHRFQPSSEVAQRFEQQLSLVTDKTGLNNLVNVALSAPTLPEIVTQLQALLPTAKPANG